MNNHRLMRWIIALLAVMAIMPDPVQAGQAKVLSSDDRTVKIGAGVDRGVRIGMLAEIYRQSAPLIHPITGENLGNPKVKIARVEVTKVGVVTAEAAFVEHYAPVLSGDIVESIEVAPTSEDQIRASVAQTRAEIKEIARNLAAEIKDNDKSIGNLRETLRKIGSSERRLQSIANDVRNLRERMVTFESRIVELEDGQAAMIMADTAEVKSMTPDDMTELRVLRRNEEEAVYLQIGAKLYRLSFEDNALVEENPAMMTGDGEDGEDDEMMMGDDLLDLEEEEGPAWYEVYWWIAPLLGVLGAVAFVLMRFLKRPSDPSEEDEEAEVDLAADGFPEAHDDDEMEDFSKPEESPEPEEV